MKNNTIKQKEFCTSVFKTIIESTGGDFNGEGYYTVPCLSDKPIQVIMNNDGYYSYIKNNINCDHLDLLKEFIGTDSTYEAITFFSTEYCGDSGKKISFFNAPIRNIHKTKDVDLTTVAKTIRDDGGNKTLISRLRSGVKSIKTQMLDYYTFSGIFETRCLEGLLNYSGLICLDIDNISNPSELQNEIINLSIPLVLIFRSPSGNGLKLVLKSSSEAGKHLDYFHYYERLFKKELGISIDKSGKDIPRACFTSYDPYLYYMHPDFVNEIEVVQDKPKSIFDFADRFIQNSRDGEKHTRLTKISYLLGGYCAAGIIEKAEALSTLKESISRRGNLADIDLAFRTIDDCFSSGESHPISEEKLNNYIDYNDRQLEEEVRNIEPPSGIEYNLDNIVYPENVFMSMPKQIQEIINKVKNENNESFLLYSFLVLSSGMFSKIEFNHNHSTLSLNLSSICLAESSSGKGATNLVKELFEEVDNSLKKIENEGKEDKHKCLFLSMNISGSELIHRLELNEGNAILYDTEITSFTSANSKEWGDYDTIFRQGASNDPISKHRRDSKDIFIKFPKVTVFLTGTPSQITSVFKDKDNGLYSRFMYYTFRGDEKWTRNLMFKSKRDVKAQQQYLLKVYNHYQNNIPDIEIAQEAQDYLDNYFDPLFEKYKSDNLLKSVVVRHGIYAWKLAITIKLFEELIPNGGKLVIGKDIIKVAIEFVIKSLSVASDLSFNLSNTPLTNAQRLVKILRQIGTEFSRSQVIDYCKSMFQSSTIDKYLKDNSLFEKKGYGKYKLKG